MKIPEGWKEKLLEEMEYRFGVLEEKGKWVDEALPIDDTQIGVEFAMDFIDSLLAAAPTPPAQEVELPRTPGAIWRDTGELDPHGTQYDCERAALTLGAFTDDELANAVFLYGNYQPDIQAVLRNEAHMPITYLTAAKDRIRWLSRKLAEKQMPAPEVEPAAVIDESDEEKFADLTTEGTFLKIGTKLYTHPANDGLRKAAEEVRQELLGMDFSDPRIRNCFLKLSAELDKERA